MRVTHFFGIIFYILIGLFVKKSQKSDELVDICRPCYEGRYENTWLGFRLHFGFCSVCKQHTKVDAIPTHLLQRKDYRY